MAEDGSHKRNRDVTTIIVGAGATTSTRDRGLLTLMSGVEAGRVIGVSAAGLKLGRSDECDLRFDDASLSRVHALAIGVNMRFVLRDEGSTNGTFVNGKRVSGAVELEDGDRVQLGSSTYLRFSLVDAAEEKTLMKVFEAGRTDALTGIANRKSFEERLETEMAYATRHASPLSLVLMDVDFFKKVNDGYGHPAGDAVLRAVAGTLSQSIRAEDAVARFGGEEFAVIMRGADVLAACVLADRLRMAIGATPVKFEEKTIHVTVSAGVASLESCETPVTKSALVSAADTRLYKAKQRGRDRVVGDD